jgi:hypothetical protein
MQHREFLWIIGAGAAGAALCAGGAAGHGSKPPLVCHWNGETCPLPEYDKERVFNLLGRDGAIGLQVQGGKGWSPGDKCRWRKLRIKGL